jgi:hypothetical protein
MFWLKGCPRCGGDLYRDRDIYGQFVACLQCGRHLNGNEEAALGRADPNGTLLGFRADGQRQVVRRVA